MATKGDSVNNKVTGEQITWLKTSGETGGNFVRMDIVLRPHGVYSLAHRNSFQEIQMQVIEGVMGLEVDGNVQFLHKGHNIVIPKAHPHNWWNPSNTILNVEVAFSPALQTERFIEKHFVLMNERKTAAQKIPVLLQHLSLFNRNAYYKRIAFLRLKTTVEYIKRKLTVWFVYTSNDALTLNKINYEK